MGLTRKNRRSFGMRRLCLQIRRVSANKAILPTCRRHEKSLRKSTHPMLWLRAFGYVVKFFQQTLKHCKKIIPVHLVGDGNLHLNITSQEFNRELLNNIEPFVYDWVSRHHGSVSAEHGLGLKKRDFIGYSKSIAAIQWMRNIKKLFDPNNILNPYKVFPENSSSS